MKGEKTLAKYLLKTENLTSLAEVLRAVQWLDSDRSARQLRRQIHLIERGMAAQPAASSYADAAASQNAKNSVEASSVLDESVKNKHTRLTKLRGMLANLEAEFVNPEKSDDTAPVRGKGRRSKPTDGPLTVSLSGNKIKMIKKWAGSFSPATLGFFLLNFPKDPWKLLSDLVHFSPKDFSLPFFLACIHGAPAPEGSMVHLAATSTKANLAERIEAERGLAACYSFFRTHFKEKREQLAIVDASIAEIVAMGFSRKAALLAREHFPTARKSWSASTGSSSMEITSMPSTTLKLVTLRTMIVRI